MPPVTNTSRSDVSSRLSVVEVEIHGMRQQLHGTATKQEVNALANNFETFTREIREHIRSSRTPITAMAGWAAVLVTLGITGTTGVYSVLGDKIHTVERVAEADYRGVRDSNDLNNERLTQLRNEFSVMRADILTHSASTSEKLREIETQFRTGGQTYNAINHEHYTLIDQLWRKAFGQTLREDTPWPVLGKER